MRRGFISIVTKTLLFFALFSCSKPFPDFNFLLWLSIKPNSETPTLSPTSTIIIWNGENISSGGSLNLGTTRIRSTSQFSFSLKNLSTNSFTGLSASITGTGSESYKITLSDSTLPANGELTVNLSFTPEIILSEFINDLTFQSSTSSLVWKILAKSIPDRYVFITTSQHNGNLGGITGADAICAAQKTSQYPNLAGTTYKAFLISSTRKVCTTANCGGGISENLNWIMEPSRKYYSVNDTEIFQTNTNAYPNLPIAISLDTSTTKYWWTGLFTDWTPSTNDNCSNWTDSTAFSFGFRGKGGVTNINAFAMGLEVENSCDKQFHLLCIEQP